MTTGKALNGKSYAVNSHVRFDEGEVASATTPRRGSLLYKRISCCSVMVSLVVMLVGCASYKERAYEIAFQCEERNPPSKEWREDAVPDVEDNEKRWNFREEEGRSRADGVSSSPITFSGKKVTVEYSDDNIVIRDAGNGNVFAEHPSGYSSFLQCAARLDKGQRHFLLVVKGVRPYYPWSEIHVFDEDFDCV